MTGFPWRTGDELLAADLNAAFANGAALMGGPFLPLSGGHVIGATTVDGQLTLGNTIWFPSTGLSQISSAGGLELQIWPPALLLIGNNSAGYGDVLQIGLFSGGNANDGATGNIVQCNNILQSNFFHTPGLTYTLAGTTGAPQIVASNASFTGAYTGTSPTAYNQFTVATDQVAGGVLSAVGISHNFGGGATAGGRNALTVQLTNVGATSSTMGGVAGAFWTFAGAAGGSGSVWYGLNPQVNVSAGANIYGVFGGGEANIKVPVGVAVNYKAMWTLINQEGDAVQGALYDTALGISSQNNVTGQTVIGWKNAFSLGRPDGQFPLDPVGTIFGLYRQSTNAQDAAPPFKQMVAAQGIDFSLATFTGNAFRSPGFAVSGTGALTLGPATLTPNSTGLQISATGSTGTAVAVAVGGSGYHAGEDVSDTAGGKYTIGSVTSGAITALTVVNAPHSASPPANPVALSGGHGTGATVNITWTAATTLALQPSGGAISSVLLTNAANDAAAASAGVGVGQWYRNGSVMMQRVA